jgi:DNA mismatch repair protein MutS2
MLDHLERDRRELEAATTLARLEAEKLARERAEVETRGDSLARAAQAEALQEIADARRAIAQAISELQRAGDASTLRRIERKMDRADRAARAAVATSPSAEKPLPEGKRVAVRKDLVTGARVWLIDMGKTAVLRDVGTDMGRIEVQVGGVRLTCALEDLAVDGRPAPSPTRPGVSVGEPVDDVIPAEVDLRGQRVDEALLELERALDDAMLAGRSHVRVIHGHGTGALRTACRSLFKRSRHVADWEPGLPDEGGDGVSLVTVSDG